VNKDSTKALSLELGRQTWHLKHSTLHTWERSSVLLLNASASCCVATMSRPSCA